MQPLRSSVAGTAVLSLLLSLSAGLAGATPSDTVRPTAAGSGCRSSVPGDVNGDGYADLAVGAPGESGRRGAVHLFYGYRGTLQTDAKGTARNDVALNQASAGVPGTSEKRDRFGSRTLLADVNGDGCADLVVGVPGEDQEAGAVSVLYGSPAGLTTTGAQQLKSTVLLRPRPDYLNGLGSVLTSGDFDGDGILDVAATGLDADALPASVAVLYGDRRGLGRGRPTIQLTAAGLDLPPGLFGTALTSGDYDGDGDTELAVGRVNGVQIVQRQGQALVAGRALTTASVGLPGRAGDYVSLGSSLATGDVQADGFDDLVMADPDYGLGEPESEYGKGAVVLLPGSRAGLTTQGSQFWTQASPGVQGKAAYGHQFGATLAVGPVDSTAGDDVVIGAPGYGGGWEQSVTLLLGSSTGLTTKGAGGTRYTQSTRGITGTTELGDSFGGSVSIAQLAGDGPGAVIIGAPGEDVGSIPYGGSITQLGVSIEGPDPRHSRTITLNSPGVQGTVGTGDHFGAALS